MPSSAGLNTNLVQASWFDVDDVSSWCSEVFIWANCILSSEDRSWFLIPTFFRRWPITGFSDLNSSKSHFPLLQWVFLRCRFFLDFNMLYLMLPPEKYWNVRRCTIQNLLCMRHRLFIILKFHRIVKRLRFYGLDTVRSVSWIRMTQWGKFPFSFFCFFKTVWIKK